MNHLHFLLLVNSPMKFFQLWVVSCLKLKVHRRSRVVADKSIFTEFTGEFERFYWRDDVRTRTCLCSLASFITSTCQRGKWWGNTIRCTVLFCTTRNVEIIFLQSFILLLAMFVNGKISADSGTVVKNVIIFSYVKIVFGGVASPETIHLNMKSKSTLPM